MRKQLAIVVDASGSMFSPSSPDCVHDKVVEAVESVQWMLDDILSHVQTTGDTWFVSMWYFASTTQGLVGQTQLDGSSTAFTTDIMKDVVQAVVNQASTQAAVGGMTDIFGALRTVSDFMESHPPLGGPLDRRSILLFTDGNQTIEYGGSTSRTSFEAAEGVSLGSLLNGRNIMLKGQGIGSDLLASTMTDLQALAAPGSTAKVISTTPGYAADCSAAIMTNALAAVNNNGVLALRPSGGVPSGLLWEQFKLPRTLVDSTVLTHVATTRLNHQDFEVEVDGISKELILGLTWHQAGQPALEVVSPSGVTLAPDAPSVRVIQQGWMSSFHIQSPEVGVWRVRVHGDPQWSAIRLNLMARGVNRRFRLSAIAKPHVLVAPGKATIIATPWWDDAPARGEFEVKATVFGGATFALKADGGGKYADSVVIPNLGLNLVRIELTGKTAEGESVRRTEFTTVQIGKPRDPRLRVKPARYHAGQSYTVDIALQDASFGAATQIRFGAGIQVASFMVQGPQQARAEIKVDATAFTGTREVVTYHPDAETLTGIEVVGSVRPGDGPHHADARICCLRFDATGALIAVLLCDGTRITVCRPSERLVRVLEQARAQNLPVTIRLDAHGCLHEIDVCG